MLRPATSIRFFGIYLLVLGVVLVVAPNTILLAFRLQPTSEIWIRVVGLLIFNLGVFFNAAASTNAVGFFWASVPVRVLVIVAFGVFVLLGLASPMLLLFGVADLLGAVWTLLALRSSPGDA